MLGFRSNNSLYNLHILRLIDIDVSVSAVLQIYLRHYLYVYLYRES